MTEYLPHSESDYKISRRDFLRSMTVAAGAVAVAYAGRELAEGVRFNKPPVRVVDKLIGDIEMRPERIFGKDGSILGFAGNALLFEPSQSSEVDPETDFFVSDKVFRYIHRANRLDIISEAFEQGANLFDIDANNLDGVIYAEHGLVPKVGDRRLPVVVDVNERGIKFGRPAYTYEELVQFIGTRSKDCGYPLGVSTELKRGVFDFDAIHQLLDIHQRHGVPVMMHGPDSENILMIGNEIAAIYHEP